MGRADARAGLTGAEILARLQRSDTKERAEHGTVDVRAFPGLASAHQRRGDRVGGVEAGAEIADRDPAFDRRTTLLAGDAHQPVHALHGHVEGALSGIRPALPIAGA